MLGFDRETLLDLTVNAIPIFIILFFMLLVAIVQQWPWDPFLFVVSHGLMAIPIVALFIVSYVAGKAISRDEHV